MMFINDFDTKPVSLSPFFRNTSKITNRLELKKKNYLGRSQGKRAGLGLQIPSDIKLMWPEKFKNGNKMATKLYYKVIVFCVVFM